MSSEARIRQIIDDAVREATEPLKRLVDGLHERLAAVEGKDGQPDAAPQKRAARGRTAKAAAQPADVIATADDTDTVPEQRGASE
jgi:hypothetical protein